MSYTETWPEGDAPEDGSRCKPDCPECHGTGSIGGDTQSAWACTVWTGKTYRNRLRKERIEARKP